MMKLTSVERFILFALGEFCSQANKKLSDKPLELAISKVEFIEIAKKINLTPKKERALYKNLETLETKRFLSYQEKNLALTDKGHKAFQSIQSELSPYISIKTVLASEEPLKYARKAQTMFTRTL